MFLIRLCVVTCVLVSLSPMTPGQRQAPGSRRSPTAKLARQKKIEEMRARREARARTLELRGECRRFVTRWLRARQEVLESCPRCKRGWVVRPGIVITRESRRRDQEGEPAGRSGRSLRGLGAVARLHRQCHGTGIRIREHALDRLVASYLPNAKEYPGLPGPPMTWTEFGRYRADDSIDRRTKITELRTRFAHVRRSAQVKAMSFEDGPGGLTFATVVTTVDPKRTRWVRVQRRWYVVGSDDERRLVESSIRRADGSVNPPSSGVR